VTGTHPGAVRVAVLSALPQEGSLHGAVPERRHVYVPPAHAKALRLEAGLVVGARGVGKSFWSAALGSGEIRALLSRSVRELATVDAHLGHAEAPAIGAYPSPDLFPHLMSPPGGAYDVWRAVVARWLRVEGSVRVPADTWDATVRWVRNEPEAFARLLEHANAAHTAAGRQGLIVFDALDRTSSDWQTMDAIVRELLRVLLLLKPFDRLHGKVFLREDQFVGRPVTDFADASKLLATRVELTWFPHDLHGLLWQYLCNARGDAGVVLREVYRNVVGELPDASHDGVWNLQDRVKRDDEVQRNLFTAVAGAWMGKGPRRGMTYTWTVNHLADARGRTTPRSFLAAIRAAAEHSVGRYPDHPYPLHFESIEHSVQEASKVRVAEIAEDYAWVPDLMAPLAGLTVPCDSGVVMSRWRDRFGDAGSDLGTSDLPPAHAGRGWEGVLEDLERIGIVARMMDGRVNMPDLYRVGFGLGRKGGVKPLVSGASS
jgi:hypothetical protein